MNPILRRAGWFAFTLSLLASPALGGECNGWFPDLNRGCESVGRPAGFAAPIAQPFLFEDAFVTTGAQTLRLDQRFTNKPPFGGGEAELVAAQLRVALTERFAFIGSKAGVIWTRPDNPLLPHDKTPIPLTLGFKYALHQDADANRFASFVLRYGDAFQSGSKGALMPSLAGALRFGDVALQGDAGGSWALDAAHSSSAFWHLHAGWAGLPVVTPFVQFSGTHWLDGGDGSTTIPLSPLGRRVFGVPSLSVALAERFFGPLEGGDLVNLGTPGAARLELITAAAGLQLRVRGLVVAAAYERPLNARHGVIGERITTTIAIEL